MTLLDNLAFLEPLQAYPYAYTVLQLAGLALAAWLANWLTRMILVRVVTRVVQATPMRWDDALMSPKVLARLANIVPDHRPARRVGDGGAQCGLGVRGADHRACDQQCS